MTSFSTSTQAVHRLARAGSVALAALLLVAAACGDGGSDEASPPASGPFTTGEPAPGDLEVDAPDGWTEIPLPSLGFGLAVPENWEAVVLNEEGMNALAQATAQVPDFAMSAVGAAQSGAVFYAAGVDAEDGEQINDLKVLADLEAEVDDVRDLATYADDLVAGQGIDGAEVTPVEGAAHPAVEVRYRTTYSGAHDRPGGESGDVDVAGAHRVVLAPEGAVLSFIVTGEDAASVDELAPEIFATIDLAD